VYGFYIFDCAFTFSEKQHFSIFKIIFIGSDILLVGNRVHWPKTWSLFLQFDEPKGWYPLHIKFLHRSTILFIAFSLSMFEWSQRSNWPTFFVFKKKLQFQTRELKLNMTLNRATTLLASLFIIYCPKLRKIRIENSTKLSDDFKRDFFAHSVIQSRSKLIRFYLV